MSFARLLTFCCVGEYVIACNELYYAQLSLLALSKYERSDNYQSRQRDLNLC